MKKNLPLVAALALAACSPDFSPASKIDKLRLLAVAAEHPELEPGVTDSTLLHSLVVRADFASDRNHSTTVVYVACLPVPGDPTPIPCVALASLRDPTSALATAAEASCAGPPADGSVPPVAFAGVESCDAVGLGNSPCAHVQLPDGTPVPAPALSLPAGYGFDALPAGSPDRILGVQAVVLAFALDADWNGEIAASASGACPLASMAARFSSLGSSREHVLSTKRVQIRGPDAPNDVNENPNFTGIAAGPTELAEAPAPTSSLPAADVDLVPTGVDYSLVQTYSKLDAAGAVIDTATEDWVYSWFSTAGEMDDLHTREPDVKERWKLTASDAAANGGHALVAAVVRDLRGGIAWQVREVVLQP